MDLSKAITQSIKKKATNLQSIGQAQKFFFDQEGDVILEGHTATEALKALTEVFTGIFGDFDNLHAHQQETLQQLIDEAEAAADQATLAGNSWVYAAYEPANMTKALTEVDMTKFRVATHAVELERLKMLQEAIKDELNRRSQTI